MRILQLPLFAYPFPDTWRRHVKNGPAALAELCGEGRFILSNLRLLYLPPVADASVSKATSVLAWALPLQDVSYAQITRSKASLFKSEKEYLTLHTKTQVQFSFRFKPVGGVAPVHVQRIKDRVDEALAKIQAAVAQQQQPVQQQQSTAAHRISLPSLPEHNPTPVPFPSSAQRPLPPHLPPIPTTRLESSLAHAPAPPLPRCTCACACHCTSPPPFPPSPSNLFDNLPSDHLSLPSPFFPQALATCFTYARPCSSSPDLHPQRKPPSSPSSKQYPSPCRISTWNHRSPDLLPRHLPVVLLTLTRHTAPSPLCYKRGRLSRLAAGLSEGAWRR